MLTRVLYVGGPQNGFTQELNLPLTTSQLGVLALGGIDNSASEHHYYLYDVYVRDDHYGRFRVAIAYHDTIELKDALEQVFESFILMNGRQNDFA